ncbi:MAG: TIGR03790 family protein [Candidatus Poseidoniales archaeon]|nr:MAG: TIGR03790 family protein [Candidatus Poseidoniales archaeon]
MSTKACSVAFVTLLLLSTVPLMNESNDAEQSDEATTLDFFRGFHVSEAGDVWNETPWQNTAFPEGFTYTDAINYSDVGVLINNLSEESRTIGWAFVAARNISLDRVFIFNASGTPVGETINRNQFNTYFAQPFLEMLQNRSSSSGLNYLVTTKGVPLRVSGGNDKASFDQEIALLGGTYNSSIGTNWWFDHTYGPLAGKAMEPFTRSEYGFFLVTRLTGYTVETALDLIERANQSIGQRGTFVLDLATNRNGSGYKFWNDDLYTANTTLNQSMGLPVHFDEETEFLTNMSNVIGYASWGSNDGNWNRNYLPNSGFDTLDQSWQSGSRYWNLSGPSVSPEDVFDFAYQTNKKQGGNGAFEIKVRTDCDQDNARMMQGLYGEYFDNDGVSFSTSSMPSLIDRAPDRVQIEPHLNHGSSYSAYTGLDDRFKNDWGARFSGFIDVPHSGNWTFFITSDDGSELWIDGVSVATNYGSHGMRERSGSLNLTEGLHDFRIEFFQGGGPHGLIFSWQGPNTSKAAVPSSAFFVASDIVPQEQHLVHHWAFEEGSGTVTNDSVGNANLTLTGMSNSNWQTCADGDCLWFDGINDKASVDVNDWYGNFTVSQWVWANTTNQSTYASTFAVDDQAGSNLSFQHMVSGGEWKLHNNQTRSFGAVVPQRWTHLVSVFDDGDIRQYMDGVLVNTNTYPNGSFNNIDLYKLGVNRAGNSYFEGKIDEVMLWDVALEDHDITMLRRTIIDNCTAYTGAGTDVAHLETRFTLPQDLMDHAWVASVYGQRSGEVDGKFGLEIDAMDGNGVLLSTNTSSSKTFTTSWATQTIRFRPDANATHFDLRIPIDIASASTSGSFFVDSVVLRALRPNMDWVNGSIADTAVSTGGRSFNWGTSYGQSLIADLLEDGVSGVKGYVYEPYLTAVGLPSVYLPAYASGYNLAESHAAANLLSGWMGVVVGDPKMAPYIDRVHDINIVDARVLGDANMGEPTTIQVVIENRGVGASNGTLSVRTVFGATVLNSSTLMMPAGDQPGSRLMVNLTIIPTTSGLLDLRIRYDNGSTEWNFENNIRDIKTLVNAPPIVHDASCRASSLPRGTYTICSLDATDDQNVTRATLEWQILANNDTINESNWTLLNLGQINNETWQTSLVVLPNASLGWIALRATAYDANNMSHTRLVRNVTHVVDVPPTWFGPHAEGVDPPGWNNASSLPNKPSLGLYRHQSTELRACVMDADFDPLTPNPIFITSRGTLSEVSYVEQSAMGLYCYVAVLQLARGTSLDDVELQVRNHLGSLLLQRTLRVADQAPELYLTIEDEAGQSLDKVVGNGEEYLRVRVDDIDDPGSSFVGDVMLQWPGGELIQLPLDIPAGQDDVLLRLEQMSVPLEGGELSLVATGVGKHGGNAQVETSIPFILTPPDIVFIEACDTNGKVRNMTFGQLAFLKIGIVSDRPLQSTYAQLTQQGWAINAPSTQETNWEETSVPDACNTTSLDNLNATWLLFRLKLDNSMVDGDGRAVFMAADIDGLTKSASIDLVFQHAPTRFEEVVTSEAIPGQDLFTNATVSDLDGLDRVICSYTLYGENGEVLTQSVLVAGPENAFSNVLRWQYPVPISLANTTLEANITCIDEIQQSFGFERFLDVGPADTCNTCAIENTNNQTSSGQADEFSVVWVLAVSLVVLAIGLTALMRRRSEVQRGTEWGEPEAEEDDDMVSLESLFESDTVDDTLEEQTADEPHQPSFVPEGWTLEEYGRWLEGPTPEGWSDEQWTEYVEEHKAALEHLDEASQG